MKYWLIPFFFISFIFFAKAQSTVNSWEKALEQKQDTILVYWYTSRPFIYEDAKGAVHGIEHDILEGFKTYVKSKYGIGLHITWKQGPSFEETFALISENQTEGVFAVSAFSITPKRKVNVGFSAPYMSDISVMISSQDVPIVKNIQEFDQTFSKYKAITIKGTTYEQDLQNIKRSRDLDFKIAYIPSSENILLTIGREKGAFGFIDLPIYLRELNRNPAMTVKRQNLFPIKRTGYAVIMPKESSWKAPLDEFMASSPFKAIMKKVTDQYLDNDVYPFIEKLYNNADDDIILLTKEKEIQFRGIQGKTAQIRRASSLRNILIVSVVIISIFLIFIYRIYTKRNKAMHILQLQKEKIEHQRKDIATQKEQLEKRNLLLTQFNNEKNSLIKILAHDLRTPINHINGLSHVLQLENDGLTENQMNVLQQISGASLRLNAMISKILDVDAIESNRVNAIREDIDLNKMLKLIASSFQKEAEKKQIQLQLDLPEETLLLSSDPLYLTQIIENLISNALKFSAQGTTIELSLVEAQDEFCISIKDEGPGFTEEDKAKVFQKFQRLSAQPTNGESSTGLGLSIVKKYTEMMGGRVALHSEKGKGTEFRLYFKKEA